MSWRKHNMHIKLEDLLKQHGGKLISGQITRRITAKEGQDFVTTAQVLLPKAMVNGCIDHNALAEEKLTALPDNDRYTKEGDIVIKLSTPYDSVIITKEDEGLLVTSFCAIIRGLDPDTARYLIAYLNSTEFNALAKASTSGSIVIVLALSFLKECLIPLPPLDEMKKIGDEYARILELKRTFDDVYSLSRKKIDLTITKIAKEVK